MNTQTEFEVQYFHDDTGIDTQVGCQWLRIDRHGPPNVLGCTGMVVEADELVAKWDIR